MDESAAPREGGSSPPRALLDGFGRTATTTTYVYPAFAPIVPTAQPAAAVAGAGVVMAGLSPLSAHGVVTHRTALPPAVAPPSTASPPLGRLVRFARPL